MIDITPVIAFIGVALALGSVGSFLLLAHRIDSMTWILKSKSISRDNVKSLDAHRNMDEDVDKKQVDPRL